jgi:hypothetical protein
MSKDAQENTEAIKELTKQVSELSTKCEVLTERLKILEKLIYGVIGLILTAVITAITRGVTL